MTKQTKIRIILTMTIAVVASVALSTVLLLGYPAMRLLVPIVIYIILASVTRLDIQYLANPSLYLTYFLSGVVILLPGILLNMAFTSKFSLTYKIIALALYFITLAVIAFLLYPYLQYQLAHQSLKS